MAVVALLPLFCLVAIFNSKRKSQKKQNSHPIPVSIPVWPPRVTRRTPALTSLTSTARAARSELTRRCCACNLGCSTLTACDAVACSHGDDSCVFARTRPCMHASLYICVRVGACVYIWHSYVCMRACVRLWLCARRHAPLHTCMCVLDEAPVPVHAHLLSHLTGQQAYTSWRQPDQSSRSGPSASTPPSTYGSFNATRPVPQGTTSKG